MVMLVHSCLSSFTQTRGWVALPKACSFASGKARWVSSGMATQPTLEYWFTRKLKSGSRGRGKVGWRFCKGEARLSGKFDGLTGGSILPTGLMGFGRRRLAILSYRLVVTGKVWFGDWRSVTHACEDNFAGSKAWSASTVTEGLIKETHWLSKFCRTRPDDVVEEGVYFGELLLRGRGQAKPKLQWVD
jgi:hypothetical protein